MPHAIWFKPIISPSTISVEPCSEAKSNLKHEQLKHHLFV